MKYTFPNIESFYRSIIDDDFDPYEKEGAFVDRGLWEREPASAEIVFIDDEDLFVEDGEEEDNEPVPRAMREIGYDFLLVGPLLVDVMKVHCRAGGEAAVVALVRAVNHYSQYDSFEE